MTAHEDPIETFFGALTITNEWIMQLKVIRTLDELDELAEEWNNLLTCCSASHVPFLRHEYLSAWWKTLGGGEWSHGELFTVIARQEDGQLVGIAPLFSGHNRDGQPALLLLGSIEISDYLDFIVHPLDIPAFVNALFDLLESDQAPAWRALDLYNLPEESPTLPLIQAAARARGWLYAQERLQPCPYITLPGDWELYLASLDKKQRHEIRRKMRRAESHTLPVRWYIVDDEAQLEAEIGDFMALMAQDPEKERFLTGVMRAQLRAAVHAAFRAGWLQLAFIEVGDQKAAGYLNFDFANHIWVYNSGLNFSLGELSPGWVLLGYLLQWAINNRRESFDFMRGGEQYKYRFGAVDRFVVRATVNRSPA
ncbi:MAG: GNAT family N-acetyltransferase [Anaerolineales bacterium]|nr:GNAT family N-acetyltransferase [Anaerolineales bacterium]